MARASRGCSRPVATAARSVARVGGAVRGAGKPGRALEDAQRGRWGGGDGPRPGPTVWAGPGPPPRAPTRLNRSPSLAVQLACLMAPCLSVAGSTFERIWCLFEMWTTLTVRDQDPLGPQQQQHANTRPQTISAEIEVVEDEEEQQEQAHEGGAAGVLGSHVPPCRRTAPPGDERQAALVMLSTGLSAAQRARLYAQARPPRVAIARGGCGAAIDQ